jgi:predicted kinase
MKPARLIIFSGLPGTGKSALAEAFGRELGIPVYAKDWLEATLRRAGVVAPPDNPTALGYAGYELLTTLATRQLHLGQSAILDSVAALERIRQQWRNLARQYGARWQVVECVCSDESLHRTRLEVRERGIPGWHELTWVEVERVKGYYEAWTEQRLVLDAVNAFEENLRQALGYLCEEMHG